MSKKELLHTYLQKMKSSGNLEDISPDGLTDSDRELLEKIWEEGLVDESLEFMETLNEEKDWADVQKRLSAKKVRKLSTSTILKYAAIFIGIVSLGIALKLTLQPNEQPVLENTITLNTGDAVKPIQEGKKQSIVLASGEVVAVQEGNTLRYGLGNVDHPVFNELHVPNGKVFTLVLSDGTEIQLNSGTHIRYPAKFPTKGNREVTMTGEAYFKVSKDKEHPFIVNSEQVAVQVLGTEFNVTAYKEQSTINTVLVEGSVSLSHESNPENKTVLEPGNKGSWDKVQETMSVEKVDTLLYTSWLNGEIVFRETPFSELLTKLERAYNVSIVNKNMGLEERAFNARYNRKVESIEDVLDALRVIAPFSYEIHQKSNTGNKEIIIN
ncbi:FecR family protein [Flagellimonas baculiformis]|uniref:FecR family protein n=1 Tax=Flagellimonas baculiformis TaxID=3067310 RepID=UPI00296F015B|nr:FecR domain-containing protein [Muricauda sp. D6]